MSDALIQLLLFTSKSIIIFILVAGLFIALIAIAAKNKSKSKGKLLVTNLNDKFDETKQAILVETLEKKAYKKYLKDKKAEEKKRPERKSIYVINFNGDIKASAVKALSEEITAILNVATPQDEVLLKLESPGGVVHGYGLAAAQLVRLREKHIPLTIAVDKVAASGGYMMACTANKLIAAPFAIIGSIGVIIQIPNFNRVLKDKHIDFEQLTAGEYKRTLTVFGENTPEGKEKMQDILNKTHTLFKHFITDYRPQVNIQEVATGEHWFGQEAMSLKLIDEIKTSDAWLLEKQQQANLYEICFETSKPLLARLTSAAANLCQRLLFTNN